MKTKSTKKTSHNEKAKENLTKAIEIYLKENTEEVLDETSDEESPDQTETPVEKTKTPEQIRVEQKKKATGTSKSRKSGKAAQEITEDMSLEEMEKILGVASEQ